jgi:hypothetical protein
MYPWTDKPKPNYVEIAARVLVALAAALLVALLAW